MSKYVNDTAAGKSISASVIMKGSRHVATVTSHYGNSGSVLVNVWNHGDAAIKRCAKARKVAWPSDKPWEMFGFQYARAGGYGYDKRTAALSGLIIDGHEMSDHCGRGIKPPNGADRFPEDFKAPKGFRLANWRKADEIGPAGYMSCHRLPGLEYLQAIGYSVIQAV